MLDSTSQWFMAVLQYKPSTKLAVLILHRRPLKSLRFRKGERLLIDSPYGQDQDLILFQKCNTRSSQSRHNRCYFCLPASLRTSAIRRRALQSEYLPGPGAKLTSRMGEIDAATYSRLSVALGLLGDDSRSTVQTGSYLRAHLRKTHRMFRWAAENYGSSG